MKNISYFLLLILSICVACKDSVSNKPTILQDTTMIANILDNTYINSFAPHYDDFMGGNHDKFYGYKFTIHKQKIKAFHIDSTSYLHLYKVNHVNFALYTQDNFFHCMPLLDIYEYDNINLIYVISPELQKYRIPTQVLERNIKLSHHINHILSRFSPANNNYFDAELTTKITKLNAAFFDSLRETVYTYEIEPIKEKMLQRKIL